MAKFNSKDILKRVKDKAKPERTNFTFRFDVKRMDAFKKACENQEVTPTAVLEEFMDSFAKDFKS